MTEKKPHTIALRLTHDEYRGLHKYLEQSKHESMTAALRALLPVDQLAKVGREAAARD